MYNLLYVNRIRRGLTQEALANLAGVSRRTVCRLETSGNYPSFSVGCRISRALNCRMEEVFPLDLSL